jgi:hypothetical protein
MDTSWLHCKSLSHPDECSVTVFTASLANGFLLPGSLPRRLAAISHQLPAILIAVLPTVTPLSRSCLLVWPSDRYWGIASNGYISWLHSSFSRYAHYIVRTYVCVCMHGCLWCYVIMYEKAFWNFEKSKSEVVPCQKYVWGVSGSAPCALNLGIAWKWMVVFLSLNPGESVPYTHWIKSRMSPKLGLNMVPKRNSYQCRASNLDPSVVLPVD